jgi:hypothetical protein
MPLTSKGKEILSSMEKTYKDPDKAKSVFYASANSGKITGVHDVTEIEPKTGPMSTKGPVGESEGLPKTTEAFATATKDTSVGKAMSMDQIKDCYKDHSMDKKRG